MSWKPEVKVSGKWSHNALVFETKEDAERSARDTYLRWHLCDDHRAIESHLPANYHYVGGVARPIESTTEEDK